MKILGGILLVFVLLLAASIWQKQQFNRACRVALRDAYRGFEPLPQLKISSFYGFPAFTVLFRSKREMDTAAEGGLNNALLQRIGKLCENKGRRDNPFRAELAVNFTHSGFVFATDLPTHDKTSGLSE